MREIEKKSAKSTKKKPDSVFKKIYYFLFESDSVVSWLVNIVLAFIIIKFLVYPGLGLLFQNDFPVVAVVSGSMEHMIINHNGKDPTLCQNIYDKTDYFVSKDEYWKNCGEWYEQKGLTREWLFSSSFPNGFNKGDIIVIYGTDTKNLKEGDVIVYQTRYRPEPIIHRIVEKSLTPQGYVFETKGDHNPTQGAVDLDITEENIYGKAVFRIPFLGWAKIWFTNIISLIMGV